MLGWGWPIFQNFVLTKEAVSSDNRTCRGNDIELKVMICMQSQSAGTSLENKYKFRKRRNFARTLYDHGWTWLFSWFNTLLSRLLFRAAAAAVWPLYEWTSFVVKRGWRQPKQARERIERYNGLPDKFRCCCKHIFSIFSWVRTSKENIW